jgi:hypothetical protein
LRELASALLGAEAFEPRNAAFASLWPQNFLSKQTSP